MRLSVAALIFSLVAAALTSTQAAAQAGRNSRSDGADARTDALLGTPNKVTPVPQTNRFSTSPRLEQQVPGPQGTAPPGNPSAPRPPVGKAP